MRRLAAASAILAAILICGVAAAPAANAAAPTDAQRTTAALEYMLKAQAANGSIDGSIGETADYVIGAAAAGYDPATLRGCAGTTSALDFVATASDAASSDAAKTAKAVLAVVAAGGDPSSFAGRNLIGRLQALYHSATGKFGSGTTFEQAFGILGLHAAGAPVAASAPAVLAALQDPDGSWSYGSAPVTAGNGDTNSTAIALMALDTAGVRTADTTGFAYLRTQQLSDGGFPYQNSSTWGPPASDPDSDSIVLEAILAAGGNPLAAGWSKGSANVLTHIRSTQGTDGGFSYPGTGESAFTTSQVPAALMRAPYGKALHFTIGRAVPKTACVAVPTPTPAATPTPTPAASPTSTPTLAPTPKPTVRPTRKPTSRPTARPVIEATDTPATTPAPAPTATPSPTPTATPSPTATFDDSLVLGATQAASADPGSGGSGSNAPDSGGVPAPLINGLAGAVGLALVLGAGWFLILNPNRKP